MKDLSYFQNEHQELLKLAAGIKNHLRQDAPDVTHLLRQVSSLGMGVLIHVIAEDNDFYPRVARCGDAALERAIVTLKKDYAGIEGWFQRFDAKWRPEVAQRDPEGLVTAVRELLTALEQRIQQENRIMLRIDELELDLSRVLV